MVRATAINAAPSDVVSADRSMAHAGPRAMRASGLPATTKPVKSPVVVLITSRRFKVTSSSIKFPSEVEQYFPSTIVRRIDRLIHAHAFLSALSDVNADQARTARRESFLERGLKLFWPVNLQRGHAIT